MKKQKWILVFFLLIVTFTVSSCTGGNGEQEVESEVDKKDPIVFKLGHDLPVSHPVHQASTLFAELVRERTDGEVEIQVFASGLGNEKALIEGIPLGTVDMAALVCGNYGYLLPEFEITALTYLFEDAQEAEKILTGPIGQELSDKLVESSGVRILHPFWYYGTRQITSNKPIETAEDLKDTKIRVPLVPIQQEGLSAMGGRATPVDFGELYMALETGVVDAQENPLSIILTNNYDKVQDYLIISDHIVAEVMLSVNEKKFQTLTQEQQDIVMEAAEEAAQLNNKLMMESEQSAVSDLEERGMTVIRPDKDSFKEAVKDLHEKYDEKYNGLVTRITEESGK